MTEADSINQFCSRVNLVLLLDHGGRAGSNFFQCLFDRHQQVVTCPLVHYVYSYWGRFFPGRDSISKHEARDFIAQGSYFRFLYQDPVGDCGVVITKIGGDISAPFDRARYRALIDDRLDGEGNISRRDLILHAYAAYALCRGFDLSRALYIMINDAVSESGEDMLQGFSGRLIDWARADFPYMVTLALLRDPRAQYASTKHQMVNELGNNYDLHKGTFMRVLGGLCRDRVTLDEGPAHLCLLYQVAAYRDLLRKWREHPENWLFLRNEDFNTAFVPTMKAVCSALHVDPDPEWIEAGNDYKARMMGRPWAGTGAYSNRYQKVTNGPLENGAQAVAVGPSRHVVERWKERLPRHEQALLENYFAYEIAYCGYDFHIPDVEKKGWNKFLNICRPWSGEIPSWRWVKKAETDVERRDRSLYFIKVWPLYALARIKMAVYERRRFFSRGLDDVFVPPEFVGGFAEPARLPQFPAREVSFAADGMSPQLLFSALFHRVLGYRVSITLAQTRADSPWHKAASRWVDIRQCPDDVGDYRNGQEHHIFTDWNNILRSLYQHYIGAQDDYPSTVPGCIIREDDWMSYFSRYIVDQAGSLVAAQLLMAHYVLKSGSRFRSLYLARTPQSDVFSRLVRPADVRLRFTMPLRLWRHDIKHLVRFFAYLAKSLLVPVSLITKGAHRNICVQYVNGPQGKVYPGDLDWLQDSKVDPQNIIYLVEGFEELDQATKDFCDSQGVTLLYAGSFKASWGESQTRAALFSACRYILRSLIRARLKSAAACAFYTVFYCRWRQFFQRHDVGCFVNVADTNLDALPKMHALESLGGIDLSFEFSATGYHAFMDSRPLGRHQYICWGDLTRSMVEDVARSVPYRVLPRKIFLAGNMRTYMSWHYSEEARIVLGAIEAHKGGRKILVMDSASTHLKFLSTRAVHDFYDAVLALIAKSPTDLFIVKPQKALNLRSDQSESLRTFQESGRVILAPWKGMPHYLFPRVDLVVGTPIYASSIMEAQAFDLPVVCFDCSGWPHVMREAMPGFCLVNDAALLAKSVDYILSGKISERDALALQFMRERVDPYRDGKGHLRFADLIRLWAEALATEGSADQALPKVVEAYGELWPLSASGQERAVS